MVAMFNCFIQEKANLVGLAFLNNELELT